MKLEKRTYEPGEMIFAEGDAGDCAFLIESGEVGIIKQIDGETVPLATLKSGEIFGEMSVIDGSPRMAGAVAQQKSVLAMIPKGVFDAKLAGADPFLRAILTIFMNNLRNAHRTYIRRPRSVQDHVRLLSTFSHSLRDYINMIELSEFSAEWAEGMKRMDLAIQELVRLANSHADRRKSVVKPAEARGVPAGRIVGGSGT